MNAIGSFFRDKTVVYRMRWLSLEICECDYCGSFIHEECIRISKFHCKQLTSSKPRIKHLWYCYLLFFWIFRLDGNIDIGTTCCICNEEITSFVNLSGKRCVWCQRVVHEYESGAELNGSDCVSELGKYCDFGRYEHYIISPSFVHSPYSKATTPIVEEDSDEALFSAPSSPLCKPQPLVRCGSEKILPSEILDSDFELSSELRRRQPSDSFDSDDTSVGSSPPPRLVEYKMSSGSDDKEPKRDRRFSWQALVNDINKNTSSIVDYVKNLQNQFYSWHSIIHSPELRKYLDKMKSVDRRSWYF